MRWRYYSRSTMPDTTDPTPAPTPDPTPAPPAPPPPTLVELAQAVEDAEATHGTALEKSNASAAQAAADQKTESDAHGALLGARNMLINAAQTIT